MTAEVKAEFYYCPQSEQIRRVKNKQKFMSHVTEHARVFIVACCGKLSTIRIRYNFALRFT